MIRCHRLEYRFVRTVPDQLEFGVLYVSMEFGTATHSCCCGCGEEVVTPFTPTGWKMTYDGETVSVWPSVGRWTLRCRSHYVIDHRRVLDAGHWNNMQAAAARQRETAAPAGDSPAATAAPTQPTSLPAAREEIVSGWWSWLHRWLFARWH